MTRVPVVTRENVAEKYRKAFDEVTASVGRPIVKGPAAVMINSPEMSKRAMNLSEFLRKESVLPDKIKELGILMAARANDCQYIWNAHAALARKAGLSNSLVDAIRDKKPLPKDIPTDEATAAIYGAELLRTHKVSQQTFDAVIKWFGSQGLTELATTMGYYTLMAFNANTFDVDVAPDQAEPVLPV